MMAAKGGGVGDGKEKAMLGGEKAGGVSGGPKEVGMPKLSFEQQRAMDIASFAGDIFYSDRYSDDEFEYRHVSMPEGLRRYLPTPPRIMKEVEWRSLGVQQSAGWEHYMVH
ncbi:hypothetical protein IWW38_006011, partial [Coemansia aciculifera]